MDQPSIEIMVAVVVPIVVAAFLSIPGILGYLKGRKKDKAEATGMIVTAATSLLAPYMAKVQTLEKRDEEREAQVVMLSRRLSAVEENNYILCEGVRGLIAQIKSLGAMPVFEIDDELCNKMGNGGELDVGHLT